MKINFWPFVVPFLPVDSKILSLLFLDLNSMLIHHWWCQKNLSHRVELIDNPKLNRFYMLDHFNWIEMKNWVNSFKKFIMRFCFGCIIPIFGEICEQFCYLFDFSKANLRFHSVSIAQNVVVICLVKITPAKK